MSDDQTLENMASMEAVLDPDGEVRRFVTGKTTREMIRRGAVVDRHDPDANLIFIIRPREKVLSDL